MKHEKKHCRLGLRQQLIIEILKDAIEMSAKEIGKSIWRIEEEITTSQMVSLYESLRGLEAMGVVRSRKKVFGFQGRSYIKLYRLIPHKLQKIQDEKQKRKF